MSERKSELAGFLRSRRRRLSPEQAGIAGARRRGARSLRREDVAWLADVGVTWYTWLEQGRTIKIAAPTLSRIAAALKLDASESEYLSKLVAGLGKESPPWQAAVTAPIRALVESYDVGLAFLLTPRWDIIAWNEPFADLLAFDGREEQPHGVLARNALWIMFTGRRSRALFRDWEAAARRMVAVFRMGYGGYVGDAEFELLVEELSTTSTDFAAMWADIDVLSPALWQFGDVRDPLSGRVTSYETATLRVPAERRADARLLRPERLSGTSGYQGERITFARRASVASSSLIAQRKR